MANQRITNETLTKLIRATARNKTIPNYELDIDEIFDRKLNTELSKVPNTDNKFDEEFNIDGLVDDENDKKENTKKPKYELEQISLPKTDRRLFKVPIDVIKADITEKRIDAFLYLENYMVNGLNVVCYSWNHMVEKSGYKFKSHYSYDDDKHICNKLRSAMNWLYESGYILDYDHSSYQRNIFNETRVDFEKLSPKNYYGRLYDFEIKYIRDKLNGSRRLTSSHVLLVLAYIRAYMVHTTFKDFSDMSKKKQKENPAVCCTFFKSIADCTHLSTKIVTSSIEWLVNAGIIVYEQLPAAKYTDKNKNKVYFKKGFSIIACCYKYKHTERSLIFDNSYNCNYELENGRKMCEKARRNYQAQ